MNAYALYLRKSRADLDAEARGEGETLAKHRAALTAYARQRLTAEIGGNGECHPSDSGKRGRQRGERRADDAKGRNGPCAEDEKRIKS